MKVESDSFHKKYSSATPYPHIVLRNFWHKGMLEKVADECEEFSNWDDCGSSTGVDGKRFCSSIEKFPEETRKLIEYCSRPKFLRLIEAISGEVGLVPDPYLLGGGIHSTINGGFLKMHADFNWHEHLKLYRRLNLLVYLNRGWESLWGGDLLLAQMVNSSLSIESKISPSFNTTVLFTTTAQSFHGHPLPLRLPKGKSRNSIALYYYVSQKPHDSVLGKSTRTHYKI